MITSLVQLLIKKQSLESEQGKSDWGIVRKFRNAYERIIFETHMNKELQVDEDILSALVLDCKFKKST